MLKPIIITLGLFALFLVPAAAQTADDATIPESGVSELQKNLGAFGGKTGLTNAAGESDLKGTIANIINIILGFLGIIAVIMILTGGYKWMMASGNEEDVKDAKGRIKNAVIGLAIVFAAYIIVNFTVRQLGQATGAGAGDGPGNPPPHVDGTVPGALPPGGTM